MCFQQICQRAKTKLSFNQQISQNSWGNGYELKNTNWWNTLVAFPTSIHLPLFSQGTAANVFILILQASFHLYFDHLENGAKEKKQHEMDGLQGQGGVVLLSPGRRSVTRNDRVHERRANMLELNSGERNL